MEVEDGAGGGGGLGGVAPYRLPRLSPYLPATPLKLLATCPELSAISRGLDILYQKLDTHATWTSGLQLGGNTSVSHAVLLCDTCGDARGGTGTRDGTPGSL